MHSVVVTWRSVRTGARKFDDGNYVVRRISKKLFFGYEFVRYYDYWIPVSDSEKTLLDIAYFNVDIDKNTLKALVKAVDRAKFARYLKLAKRNLDRRRFSSIVKKIGTMMKNSS